MIGLGLIKRHSFRFRLTVLLILLTHDFAHLSFISTLLFLRFKFLSFNKFHFSPYLRGKFERGSFNSQIQ